MKIQHYAILGEEDYQLEAFFRVETQVYLTFGAFHPNNTLTRILASAFLRHHGRPVAH